MREDDIFFSAVSDLAGLDDAQFQNMAQLLSALRK
jgi:hypothetical protein